MSSPYPLDAGPFLIGAAELALLLAALAHGAYRARRALLPGWSGAPARLAELVLGVVGLTWVAEALGTFGAFTEAGLLIGSILAALATGWAADSIAARRGALAPSASPPAMPASSLAKLVATGVCAALAAGWMVPTLGTLAAGMDRADTLWYHMPLAAKFVQTGHLDHIYFFDPVFLASFYPANSEVVHAAPILFFDRDIVSPVLNLGWLAMALLAAWCIGRPYGLGPQSLIGGAVVLGSQSLVEFQAGEALNDITGTAFILAAAAILVNAYAAEGRAGSAPTAGLAIAGLATGLAAGTKLSFLAPAAALALGVVAIARGGTRLRAALAFGLPAVAAGGYWYARNLFAVGNPIPYVGELGPISLPAPVRDFHLRPGFSVFHYWNDTGVWQHWFGPGLDDGFGALWPVTIAGTVAVGVYALWRGREPILRALGFVVLLTAVAYAVTPLTAAGEEGEPIAFVWNLRYLAPAIAVGLAMLPCLPALRATAGRRAATAAALTVLVAFTVGSLVQWQQGHTKGAVAAALGVLAVAGAVALMRSRATLGPAATIRARAAVGVAAAAAVLAAGWWEQDHYLTHRYENTGDAQDLDAALRWSRDLHDQRVAISGIRGVFTQYPFYGTDLSSEVQWLGEKGPHDAYLRIADCATWRRAIDAGGYDYVVTTFDPYLPTGLEGTPEGRWTQSDPNASVVRSASEGPVKVFRIEGPLDPAGCAGLRPLPERKLHGVPNLTGVPNKD